MKQLKNKQKDLYLCLSSFFLWFLGSHLMLDTSAGCFLCGTLQLVHAFGSYHSSLESPPPYHTRIAKVTTTGSDIQSLTTLRLFAHHKGNCDNTSSFSSLVALQTKKNPQTNIHVPTSTALSPSSSSSSSSSLKATNINDIDTFKAGASTRSVLLSMVPILYILISSKIMKLNLRSRVIVSVLRNFVQLSLLSFILRPIFTLKNPALIGTYLVFMTTLAAYESSRRTKYKIQGQFKTVLLSLLPNVALSTFYTFKFVIQPKPIYNPQCVIPVTGMILGNCINGISLGLNSIIASMIEQQREIELYLSFGASNKEAISRLLREAITVGMTPILNNMSVMGLISIPGMMTGQILGGSGVIEAARWQMMIMYLIASCLFGVVFVVTNWTAMIGMNGNYGIRRELFQHQDNARRAAQQKSLILFIQAIKKIVFWRNKNHLEKDLNSDDNDDIEFTVATNRKIQIDTKSILTASNKTRLNKKINALKVDNLSMAINTTASKSSSSLFVNGKDSNIQQERFLFENLSFEVKEGQVAFITGQSGSGKSSMLRVLARLSRPTSGDVSLLLQDDQKYHDRNECWRRDVRYLTQYKVDLPGTPMDAIKLFQVWNERRNESKPRLSSKQDHAMKYAKLIVEEVRRLINKWGLPSSILDQQWMTLSGGESQRVILAMAIASDPKVLLLDESTSALDLDTKLIVERTIIEEVEKRKLIVVWVSHDSSWNHVDQQIMVDAEVDEAVRIT